MVFPVPRFPPKLVGFMRVRLMFEPLVFVVVTSPVTGSRSDNNPSQETSLRTVSLSLCLNSTRQRCNWLEVGKD